MGFIFEPDVLHSAAQKVIGLPHQEMFSALADELGARYPGHIQYDQKWIFNNAGGAMGMFTLLHGSLSEYLMIFGTPIGTEGHSGRYRTEVYDFVLDGEMWCYTLGEFERCVYQPGEYAYLGKAAAKGYRIPDHVWMLEYARGPIALMLPFGLADTLLSTLDYEVIAQTIWRYGKAATRELFCHHKI